MIDLLKTIPWAPVSTAAEAIPDLAAGPCFTRIAGAGIWPLHGFAPNISAVLTRV
jgi:hypothetical protein